MHVMDAVCYAHADVLANRPAHGLVLLVLYIKKCWYSQKTDRCKGTTETVNFLFLKLGNVNFVKLACDLVVNNFVTYVFGKGLISHHKLK